MIKNLILCADDYAQDSSINEGILKLAHLRKLNAISCITNITHWSSSHQDLKSVNNFCFLGLHLNLTFGSALSRLWQENYGQQFYGLMYLLKKSYFSKLNPAIIEAEISAQLDAFMQSLGHAPDFIDGHQHVHQLPYIRNALVKVYQRYKLNCLVRSSSNGLDDLLKITRYPKPPLITLLGGISFKKQLKQTQIPTNMSFAGIYNFSKAMNYRQYFQHFLSISQDNGLIMCHPGLLNNDKRDPLYQSRPHEFNYFMSDTFLVDLNKASFQLRFKGK